MCICPLQLWNLKLASFENSTIKGYANLSSETLPANGAGNVTAGMATQDSGLHCIVLVLDHAHAA